MNQNACHSYHNSDSRLVKSEFKKRVEECLFQLYSFHLTKQKNGVGKWCTEILLYILGQSLSGNLTDKLT